MFARILGSIIAWTTTHAHNKYYSIYTLERSSCSSPIRVINECDTKVLFIVCSGCLCMWNTCAVCSIHLYTSRKNGRIEVYTYPQSVIISLHLVYKKMRKTSPRCDRCMRRNVLCVRTNICIYRHTAYVTQEFGSIKNWTKRCAYRKCVLRVLWPVPVVKVVHEMRMHSRILYGVANTKR